MTLEDIKSWKRTPLNPETINVKVTLGTIIKYSVPADPVREELFDFGSAMCEMATTKLLLKHFIPEGIRMDLDDQWTAQKDTSLRKIVEGCWKLKYSSAAMLWEVISYFHLLF